MIEKIVDYIQSKGYKVYVLPGALLIRKMVEDQIVGIDWAISRLELNQCPDYLFLDQADRYMHSIEEAIQSNSYTNL